MDFITPVCYQMKRLRIFGTFIKFTLLCALIFLIIYYLYDHNFFNHFLSRESFDGPFKHSQVPTKELTQIEERIFILTKLNRKSFGMPDVDTVLAVNDSKYVLFTLKSDDYIHVPDDWCSDDVARKFIESSQVAKQVRACHNESGGSLESQNLTAMSIRLLRDTLQREKIPFAMACSSLMASGRYNQRTPFDAREYDISTLKESWPHLEDTIVKLVQNSSTKIRIIDSEETDGSLRLGLACSYHEGLQNTIPIDKEHENDCEVKINFYPHDGSDVIHKLIADGAYSYQPIDGTLYPSIRNSESIQDHNDDEMCILNKDRKNRALSNYCSNITLPCAWMNVLYPRIRKISSHDNKVTIEIGLENSLDHGCQVYSIFYRENIA